MPVGVHHQDTERVAEVDAKERRNGRGEPDPEVEAVGLVHEIAQSCHRGEELVHDVRARLQSHAVDARGGHGLAAFDLRAREPAAYKARFPGAERVAACDGFRHRLRQRPVQVRAIRQAQVLEHLRHAPATVGRHFAEFRLGQAGHRHAGAGLETVQLDEELRQHGGTEPRSGRGHGFLPRSGSRGARRAAAPGSIRQVALRAEFRSRPCIPGPRLA